MYREFLMITCAWPGVRARDSSLLIKVHECENSTKPPLIWCGGTAELTEMIAIIGKERSIYGVQTTANIVKHKNHVIADLANYYAEEIINTIPSSIYLVAGNCIGSFLVSEIALILHNKGYKIGFVGVIERDVTEKAWSLTLARLTFYASDLAGHWVNGMRQTYRSRCFNEILKINQNELIHIFATLRAMLGLLGCRKIINIFSKINRIEASNKQTQTFYELKPYPYKLNLIFIRWGVFGMYQFKYFQRFWAKLAQNGMVVDLVPGHSHYHPKWNLILNKLNARIKEAEALA